MIRVMLVQGLMVAAISAMLVMPLPALASCKYEYGDASVVYMTPNGDPVVYRMYSCGTRFKRKYLDLNGREWEKYDLVPSVRHQLNEALEMISGQDLDINESLDKKIRQIAIERGLIR